MGGHGALTLYLASKTNQFRSASAFAPIANLTQTAVGQKALNAYLQNGVEEGKELYDATELIARSKDKPVHILIDHVGVYLFLGLIQRDHNYDYTGHRRRVQGPSSSGEFLEGCSRGWPR
jgi:S-formylglutathione hydrolase FrmB